MFDKAIYEKEHESIYRWYREKYAGRNSCLIPDGVLDPEQYTGILFLLKEAYSKNQQFGEWDLAKTLAKSGPWGPWGHVAKWVYGLLHTDAHTVAAYRDLSWAEKNALLRKMAVINLKKVDGKTSSTHEDLIQVTTANAEILRREIAHVRPRIIVCGGTFRYLKELYGIEIDQNCDNRYDWLDLGERKNVLVLDYFHPSARYPELLTYYGLSNIYHQALLHPREQPAE